MVKGNPLPCMSNHDNAYTGCGEGFLSPRNPKDRPGITGGTMIDDTDNEPMTAQDVQIQAMQAQIDALKADYDKQLKSYQDANKQLFSMLNRSPEIQDVQPVQAPVHAGFDMDSCAEAFYRRIDRKQEE